MADRLLVDALAGAVLCVAVFCAGRLLLGAVWRRPAERDVDVTHVVMGVSMAGMLTGWLSGAWTLVWLLAFVAATCWFAVRAAGELRSGRTGTAGRLGAGGGHLPHVSAAVAMLYMLVAMRWLAAGGGHSMAAGMGPAGAVAAGAGTPVLALSVAGLLVLDAAVSASRAMWRPAVAVAGGCRGAATAQATGGGGARPLAPRGTATCAFVMSVAMAYMLVAVRL